MRRLPDLLQLAIGLGLVAALTAFKLTVGQSVTTIDFLFLPVVGVGWFASKRRYGYVVAVLAVLDTVMVAMIAETQASFWAAAASGLARTGTLPGSALAARHDAARARRASAPGHHRPADRSRQLPALQRRHRQVRSSARGATGMRSLWRSWM